MICIYMKFSMQISYMLFSEKENVNVLVIQGYTKHTLIYKPVTTETCIYSVLYNDKKSSDLNGF